MKRFLEITQTTSCWFWILVFTSMLAAGCASTKQSEALNSLATAEFDKSKIANLDGDRFAVGDFVSVTFSGAKGLMPSHQEHIKQDGTITLFLIGTVKAGGKTPGELLKEIHDRYVPRFYKRLVVTVYGGQNVYYVEGEVGSPGRQTYLGPVTVTKAIQSAGGLTDMAVKQRVQLIRANGQTIDVNWFKSPPLDPQVFPGDRIVVPKRGSWDVFQQ